MIMAATVRTASIRLIRMIDMLVKAQPVAKNSKMEWCRPNEEYAGSVKSAEIDLDDYEVIDAAIGELPASDEKWPKGAPHEGRYKVGNQIVQKRKVF